MSEIDVSDFASGLTWQGFCKAYAQMYGVNYPVAVSQAGEAWKEYKELHKIVVKNPKVGKQPNEVVVSRKNVPMGPSGKKIKSKMYVKPPPKGYRMVVRYIREEEDVAEKPPAEVVDARVKAPPTLVEKTKVARKQPAPKKKAGLVKKKKEEVPDVTESEEEEEEAYIVEEASESEEEESEEE